MRLGSDGPSTTIRDANSMAPIVYLGLNKLFICIHNRTNPNEVAPRIPETVPIDVCGNHCNLAENFIGQSSSFSTMDSGLSFKCFLNILGLSSIYNTPTWITITIAQKKVEVSINDINNVNLEEQHIISRFRESLA